jgi:DNA-binding protein HU-beta
MNKSELIDAIAADAGITKAAAKLALESFLGNVGETLKKGGRVSLVGFDHGQFQLELQETEEILKQEKLQIAKKNVVKFSRCRIRRRSKLI